MELSDALPRRPVIVAQKCVAALLVVAVPGHYLMIFLRAYYSNPAWRMTSGTYAES
jgi:hypothetical protein